MRTIRLPMLLMALLASLGLTLTTMTPASAISWKQYLRGYDSGKCADDPGWNTGRVYIDQWDCVSQANEQWTMIGPYTANGRGGYYMIKNVYSGRCLQPNFLNSNNDVAIVQGSCSPNGYGDLWYIMGGTKYAFGYQNAQTGLCLHVPHDSHANGEILTQHTCGSPLYHDNLWLVG